MVEPWRTGKVIRIENATFNTRRFWIEVQGIEVFHFKPGQFVTLDLPIAEKPNKRWRSYSIASYPDGTNVIELIIVLLEGGLGSNYLFNEIIVGSELTLRGPQGVFVLPETIDRDLFLVCTGTGVAPFRSMVYYIHQHHIPYQRIYLIFGTRYLSDCLYKEELEQLTTEMQNFYYLPTFSREDESLQHIHHGYVHHLYEEIVIKDENPSAWFYLCGWKNMIDEARNKIIALGYDKHNVKLELYG
jgi:ferredoxin-NADP reductase